MLARLSLLVCVAAACGSVAWAAPPAPPSRIVLPWLCLERCNGTSASIAANLKQLVDHNDVLTAASFEMFNLGAGGALVLNNLTRVDADVARAGLLGLPMISSYPYPPQFLDWMREVFADPQPFIGKAVAAMRAYGLRGFNVDWEPTSKAVTEDDARAYAAFLSTFADAVHAEGGVLSVDTATWSQLWNYTLISQSRVDYIMTMATYTDDPASFERQLLDAVAQVAPEKLVVGLETVKASSGAPYSTAELKVKFDLLKQHNVRSLGFWKSPIPDNWWPFVNEFVAGEPGAAGN